MNCQQFTFLIVETARGRLIDAAARDGATRHVETCAACAARLAQEQSLTSALRTAATGMKELNAPARVEAKLLAAFRENLATAQATATASPVTGATHAPVALVARDEMTARPSSSRRRPWRTAAVTTAIAASLALVALVTLYKQFAQTSSPSEVSANVAEQRATEPSRFSPAVAIPSPPQTLAVPVRAARRDRSQTAQRADSQRASLKLARAATPKMIASQQVIDGGSAIFAAGDDETETNDAGGTAKLNEAESVTEFIPLVAGATGATPLESGQLVRVRLPSAALASLGLPLNAERGNEPVKADVLLGNDGLARAIRFVR